MSNLRFVRIMGWAATLVVGTAIVIGFWVAGSPIQARKESSDRQRSESLAQIASAVRSYYAGKKLLPASLDDLKSYEYLPDTALMDPVTASPYQYTRLGQDTFRLCAVFETAATRERTQYYYPAEFSTHPQGRYCFTLAATGTK